VVVTLLENFSGREVFVLEKNIFLCANEFPGSVMNEISGWRTWSCILSQVGEAFRCYVCAFL